MADILKLINNDPPGGRWKNNTIAAGNVAKDFEVDLVVLTKSEAGPDAKAPAVYLNDKALSEIKGIRDGKITEAELFEELSEAKVPRKNYGGCCSPECKS